MRDSVQNGRNSAALREPNFGELLGSPKRPRRPLETRREPKNSRAPEGRFSRMRIADILAGEIETSRTIHRHLLTTDLA